MTLQTGDPWGCFAPKIGWSEHAGPRGFRIVFSADEVRIANALYVAEPEMGAYSRAVEAVLEREGLHGDVTLAVRTEQRVARGIIGEAGL